MSKPLIDPKTHKDWVSPHSHAWYAQLARLTGKYSYSWNSTLTEPNGESIFTDEVSQMVRGKRVLDIGCGHGEFAMQWSPVAKQIVGIDITNDFVEAGNNANVKNVSFCRRTLKTLSLLMGSNSIVLTIAEVRLLHTSISKESFEKAGVFLPFTLEML